MAILQLILITLVSMLAVRWAYYRVLRIARLKNLVDNPDSRKIQKLPVPVLGGLAVLATLCWHWRCDYLCLGQSFQNFLDKGA